MWRWTWCVLCLSGTLAAAVAPAPTPAAADDSVLQLDDALLRQSAAARHAVVLQRLQASVVHLPSHCRLAQAIEALSAHGNTTQLGAGVDAHAMAEIHQEGDGYWDAVAAVCAAFQLQPDPGLVIPPSYFNGQVVPSQAGTVVLGPAHTPGCLVVPCGPLGAIVTQCTSSTAHGAHNGSTVRLTCTLRFEPRIPPEQIGCIALQELVVSDASGAHLTATPREQASPDREHSINLVCSAPTPPTAIDIRCTAAITLIEPWQLHLTISAGQTRHIACAGSDLTVELVDENHQGVGGNSGPLLEIDYPRRAVFEHPELTISRMDTEVPTRGQGTMGTMNAESEMILLQGIDAQPYSVKVTGRSPISSPYELPLHGMIPIPTSSGALPLSPEVAQFVAAPVRWTAGKRSLTDALALLGHGGQPVLLELGADESQVRELPAFTGTFWEAFDTICTAYHLTARIPDTLPPAIIADNGAGPGLSLTSGPVSVGTDPVARTGSACGVLLVQDTEAAVTRTHGLGGGGNALVANLLVRLEPHIDVDSITSAQALIDSFGTDDQGHPVLITVPDEGPIGRGYRGRHRRQEPSAPHLVHLTATGLSETAHWIEVSGQLHLQLHHHERLEGILVPTQSITLGGDPLPLVATLEDQAHAQAAGAPGPGLLLSGNANQLAAAPVLIMPSGERLAPGGMSGVRDGMMFYRFPVTEQGKHTLLIERDVPAGEVTLPLHHRIPVPGG